MHLLERECECIKVVYFNAMHRNVDMVWYGMPFYGMAACIGMLCYGVAW